MIEEENNAAKLLGIPVSSIGGNIIPRENGGVATSDFAKTLHAAMISISNQLQLAASPPNSATTLREMEIAKHKTNCAMNAVEKVLQLQNMQELLINDHLKFKREAEMNVLNPLLSGLGESARISDKTLAVLSKKISVELESTEPDLKRLEELQEAHMRCIGALEKTVNATHKTIRLERDSGNRVAERKAEVGKNLAISYLANLDTPPSGESNPTGTVVEEVTEAQMAAEKAAEEAESAIPKIRKLSPDQMVRIVGQGLLETNVPVSEAIPKVDMLVDLQSFPFQPIPGEGFQKVVQVNAPSLIEGDDFDMDPSDEFSILNEEE